MRFVGEAFPRRNRFFLLASILLCGTCPALAEPASTHVARELEIAQAENRTEDRVLLRREGSLEDGDAVFSQDGRLHDRHTFDGRAGQFVQLMLTSAAFDGVLILLDPEGNAIAENDDATIGDRNPSIALRLPRDGTYDAIVKSHAKGRGAYVLVLAERTKKEVRAANRRSEAVRTFVRAQQLRQEGSATSLQEAAELFEDVARQHRKLGDLDLQARALSEAGAAYNLLGETQKMLETFERVLSIERALGDRAGEAFTLTNLGVVYRKLGAGERALAAYDRALVIFRELGDRRGEASTLSNIGVFYDFLGEKQRAAEYYERVLPIFRELGDGVREANLLYGLGAIYFGLGERQEAFDRYERALQLHREAGDRRGEVRVLQDLAWIRNSLGEREKALELYERVLALWQALGDRAGEGYALNAIGAVYQVLRDGERALEFYERAADAYWEANDRAGTALAFANLGFVSFELGKRENALTFFERSLKLYRETGDRRAAATLLGNLGSSYFELGDRRQALKFYERSLAEYRELGDREAFLQESRLGEAQALNRIGSLYSDTGDKQQALERLNLALQIFQSEELRNAFPQKSRAGESDALQSLGGLYNSLGEYRRALELFQQALELTRGASDTSTRENRDEEISILNLLGVTYRALEENQEALQHLEAARSLARETGNRYLEAAALNNLALLRYDAGEEREALEDFERALAIAQSFGDRIGEATTLNNAGSLHLSQGNPSKALEYHERALEIFRDFERVGGEARSLQYIAEVERDRGKLDAALSKTERALSLLEDLRAKVNDLDLRASFFAARQRYYEFYIDLLMERHQQDPAQGYDARALHATERSRARSLLDLLAEADTDIRAGIDPALLEKEEALQQRISSLETQRLQLSRGDGNAAEVAAIATEIDSLLEARRQLAIEIRSSSPAYADIEYPQPLDLKDIQKDVLDEDTLLLQYALGEERSFLWAVTQDGLEVYELPPRKEIETAARTFRDTLTNKLKRRLPSLSYQAAADLGQLVLGPVASELDDRRLLVVADGALHYIPFSALDVSGDDGEYVPLIRDREVAVAPSATVLATLRAQTKDRIPAPNAVAVLADPVFGGRDDPRVKKGAIAENVYIAGNSRDFGIALPPDRLPGTRSEAETILALAPDAAEFSAFGFDANLEAATDPNLKNYRIVHFATHGFANSNNPALSGLVFSLVDENLQPVNGFLRLNDIFNLDLPVELVVLSACQTGLGGSVRGEGLVGLTRGFMYAGSPRLIVSLWSVDDAGTSALMQRFYRSHLDAGLSPAAALRQAQLELLQDEKLNHPFYWSAFAFQGEWR